MWNYIIAKLNPNFHFNFSLSFELSLQLLSIAPPPTQPPTNRVSSESPTSDLKNILTQSRKHLT